MDKEAIKQKIEILKKNKKALEIKIQKLKDQLKKLESNPTIKEKYFTDASQRNGKTKIAIYSPTKDIKKSKEIANCNTAQAEFLAIQWALSHANTKKEYAIIYNDNSSSIKKAKTKFKKHTNIEFLWIPRKENKIADELARI